MDASIIESRIAFIGSLALKNRLYTEGVLAHTRKHPFH